jgi:uncharacterized protein (TIGR02246 family)
MRFVAAILMIMSSVTSSIAFVAAQQGRGATPQTAVGKAGDEAGLSKLSTAFEEAIDKADFKAAAGLWTPDGAYVALDGQRHTGAADIQGALSGALTDLKLTLQNTSVHFVKPDVAVVSGTWRVSGASTPPTDHGEFVAVATRGPGGWKYAEVRSFVPAPM